MKNDAAHRALVANLVLLIGRDKARIDIIEKAIRNAEPPRPNLYWPANPKTKKDKKIAARLASAIGSLERKLLPAKPGSLTRLETVGLISRAMYGERDEFFEWLEQARHWKEKFEAFVGLAKEGPNVFDEFKTDDPWPLGHANKATKDLVRRHSAVRAAAGLLVSHGLPLTSTRPRASNRGSLFCRAAAVLYGKRADLSHHCRAYIKARKQGSK
jgi:hypothetical protein